MKPGAFKLRPALLPDRFALVNSTGELYRRLRRMNAQLQPQRLQHLEQRLAAGRSLA
jgi:hypothetical protein